MLPLLAAVVVLGGVAAAVIAGAEATAAHRTPGTRSGAPASSARPNIIFVLTDDLSLNLLRFMPHVRELQRRGLTFRNYFVSDSLCCPSRSSIFTGELPHDTGIYGNVGPTGGFNMFHRRGLEQHTFALALHNAGYLTGMMGKYLNGYMEPSARAIGVPAKYVPPGWSEWDVAGWGYNEFNYRLNQNGRLHFYGRAASDYLTDVLARRGVSFLNRAAAAGRPFFLELATFAPHGPYVPAPRDALKFPTLRAPRPKSFNALPKHPPDWLAPHRRLSGGQIATIDTVVRRRVQSVQAIDAMIASVEAVLAARGLARNTYFVFSSDNGYHTGEYRLMPGKLTAFDTDIHVPLVISGPRIPAGASTNAVVENIDLAETFAAIGGTSLPGDGTSLLPLLAGQRPVGWRNAVIVEHQGPDVRADAPDFQEPVAGNPDTYYAIRSNRFLYVEYRDRSNEFYDLRKDPSELHNRFRGLTRPQQALLHAQLLAMKRCHFEASCWAAMHIGSGL